MTGGPPVSIYPPLENFLTYIYQLVFRDTNQKIIVLNIVRLKKLIYVFNTKPDLYFF